VACPTLTDLPSPSGNRGWPWTVESAPPEPESPGRFPRITIVTPSYQQGEFLEAAIRSVLLQGYPDLHYIVVDGGSTDSSLSIIRKYERWISYWVSEPDGGQAEAINKGLAVADGEIIGWVNSDDLLTMNALGTVARSMSRLASVAFPVLIGGWKPLERLEDPNSAEDEQQNEDSVEVPVSVGSLLWPGKPGHQPSTFWVRELQERVGLLDQNLHYAFDTDLWIRMLKSGATFFVTKRCLALVRTHPGSKTVSQLDAWIPELRTLARRHLGGPLNIGWWRYYLASLMWQPSLSLAHKSWEFSKFDRRAARRLFVRALLRFPPAVLRKPRVFAAAAYRSLLGWPHGEARQ
jgi:glycosyltransferase involved in cell wall biosynthesis